jgi:hypothetical protein
MHCDTARLLLAFARPRADELDAADAADLDQHLTGCPDCAAAASAQSAFDAAIGRAMRKVDPAEGLRQRIHQRLDADLAERTQRRRKHWMRVKLYGAAAAVVLALLGGYLAWRFWQKTPVDPNRVWEEVARNEVYVPPPEEIDAVFSDKMGVKTLTPRDFKYEYLTFYGLSYFEGRQVPYLYFQNKSDQQVQVRILSDQQFDLTRLEGDGAHRDDGYSRKLEIRWSADRHFAYLIVYTGGEPLWLRPPAPEAL